MKKHMEALEFELFRKEHSLERIKGSEGLYLRKHMVQGKPVFRVVERIPIKGNSNDLIVTQIWLTPKQIQALHETMIEQISE